MLILRWRYSALAPGVSSTRQLSLESFRRTLLSGPALDLRNYYFGELALTDEMLLEQHEKSIAPIKGRWFHEVHQRMDSELQVRKVLGEKEAWDTFGNNSIRVRIWEADGSPAASGSFSILLVDRRAE